MSRLNSVRRSVDALSHTTRCNTVYSTHPWAALPGREALWNKSGARKVLISAIRAGLQARQFELEDLVNGNVITP
jgi:hypothetical protein